MEKVCIICPEHGEFWQTPTLHLSGQGCPKCVGKNLSQEDIINKFKAIHGDKYDYSKVVYEGMHKKICIICPEHGEFWQTPSKHILGQGCGICSRLKKRMTTKNMYLIDNKPFSVGEMDIYQMLVEYLGDDKVFIRKNKFNIFIPSLNIGVNYYDLKEIIDYKWLLYDKTIECETKGIKLIQIFEDEYLNNKELVFNKIKHILKIPKICPKIMGRKIIVKEIDKNISKDFLNRNHIQGYTNSTVRLGAFYQGVLTGVMCFNKTGADGEWILNRFATDNKYICQGVGGKLFKHFVKEYNPCIIKSFADRRWTLSEDNIYSKLGFTLVEKLNPDYRYISDSNSRERIHKFNLRKKTLHNKYNFPIDMTEKEMVKNLGLYKIWDCGLYKYEWNKKREE